MEEEEEGGGLLMRGGRMEGLKVERCEPVVKPEREEEGKKT